MINIAQILCECPKNTKLYSPIFGDVYLYSTSPYVISVTLNENGKSLEQFLCDGKYTQNGECMLFPSKEQRDWSKFQRPFKNGDIIYNSGINAITILRSNDSEKSISHAFLNTLGDLNINHYHSSDLSDWRFATEEEKAKLFKAIKDHGRVWNTESKALEELIDPKFKVGDKIRVKNGSSEHRIIDGVFDNFYSLQMFGKIDFTDQDNWELVPDKLIEPKFKVGDVVRSKKCPSAGSFIIVGIKEGWYLINLKNYCIKFEEQDNYELVPSKFDINTLVPFESRVLVRDCNSDRWKVSFWGCLKDSEFGYKYDTVRGCYKQCIPYEGNEHLLGKTDKCIDFYKTW